MSKRLSPKMITSVSNLRSPMVINSLLLDKIAAKVARQWMADECCLKGIHPEYLIPGLPLTCRGSFRDLRTSEPKRDQNIPQKNQKVALNR